MKVGASLTKARSKGFFKKSDKIKDSITDQNDIEDFIHLSLFSESELVVTRSSSQLASIPQTLANSGSMSNTMSKDLQWIRLPRKPAWSHHMSADELHHNEEKEFYKWRQALAEIENKGSFILTPFERNLQIWRELWRVLESSELLVQIVDARNPSLFFCRDLYQYYDAIKPDSEKLLILNKADLLTPCQRKAWAKALLELKLDFIFYSACGGTSQEPESDSDPVICSHSIFSSDNLEDLFTKSKAKTIGMTGFPNVGKSTLINSLCKVKRVSMGARPGKTKHLQSIPLTSGKVLLDCPGLVFPNVAVSRAHLVVNGVLPIDEMKDWRSPIDTLLELVPKDVLEKIYGVEIASKSKALSQEISTSDFLSSVAAIKGFRTSFHGNPDESRASRLVLKDFVSGKIPFCTPPNEDCTIQEFNSEAWSKIQSSPRKLCLPKFDKYYMSDISLDEQTNGEGFHIKSSSRSKGLAGSKKHWKKLKK